MLGADNAPHGEKSSFVSRSEDHRWRSPLKLAGAIIYKANYLAEHHGGEAAVEFQRIIDHRGIVNNDPIGALARLGLARAYALQGDTAKARTAYKDFLTLWKDADPDIPILQQAKAEYAKLR